MSAASTETLFEDEEIVVRAQPGNSARPTLITFGDYTLRPDATGFWGSIPAAKIGWPAIGFVARRPNWYPATSVIAAAEIVRAHSGPVSVGYGYSMGGYGTLKYGCLLGLKRALALSPQVSISPDDLPYDQRYHSEYHPVLHRKMLVRAADLPPASWAIFDPQHVGDAQNIALLEASCLQRIPVRGMFHSTTRLIANQHWLAAALELLLLDDTCGMRRALRGWRHEMPFWHAGMGAALMGHNRVSLGGRFLERARAMGVTGQEEAEVLSEVLTAKHVLPGRPLAHRPAECLLERLLGLPGRRPEEYLDWSLRLAAAGQFVASRRAAERGLKEVGPHAALMTHLGHLLLAQGEPAGALDHLESAVGLAPCEHWGWVGASLARLRCGNVMGAEEAAHEAARLQPTSFHPLLALGEALIAQNRLVEAAQAFRDAGVLGGGDGAARGLDRARRKRTTSPGVVHPYSSSKVTDRHAANTAHLSHGHSVALPGWITGRVRAKFWRPLLRFLIRTRRSQNTKRPRCP